MKRDVRVVLFGEDIAEHGGAFGVTNELLGLFGRDRVFNTSISESGIVGTAIGMAMTGLVPVAEIMFDDFILMAMDQIGNQAAKWSYMSGGGANKFAYGYKNHYRWRSWICGATFTKS